MTWKGHRLVFAGIFVLGLWISLFSTSSGLGLESDSYIYSSAAQSLSRGQGYRIPVSPDVSIRTAHFPPLYPAMIAAGSLIIGDLNQAARWLNAVFFGANVSLAAYALFRLTGGSKWVAVCGAVLTAGADGLLLVHAHLWSEPAFLFFTMTGLLLLAAYLNDPKISRLAAAAGCIAAAFLTRYIGVLLIGTGWLVIAIEKATPLRQKFVRTLGFLGLSAAPGVLWLIENLRITGSLTNRQFGIHWINSQDLLAGARAVLNWFLPDKITDLIQAPVFLLMMLAALALLTVPVVLTLRPREAAITSGSYLPSLRPLPFWVFTILYPLFLVVSMSFFDAQTSLDTRILSPALVTGTIALVPPVWRAHQKLPRPFSGLLRFAVAFYLIAFGLSGWETARTLQSGRDKGYASAYWTESRLIRQIAELPPSTLIYSNAQDVIYLLTGRTSASLPRMLSPNSLEPNPAFEAELTEMAGALRAENGVLVLFDTLANRRYYLPSENELIERLELERISRWRDEGSLYRLAPP